MPKYKVSLTRSYIVEIEAKNENDAKEFTEYFLDDVKDLSTQKDKKKHSFNIIEIEPTENEAFEAEEVKSDISN
jgi:hypothetical protein